MTTETKKLEVEISYLNKLAEKYKGNRHLFDNELKRVLGKNHFHFPTSTFINVRITGEEYLQYEDLPTSFFYHSFRDCEFVGVMFTSNIHAAMSVVRNSFKNCSFRDVSFRGCVVSANFENCVFEKVRFAGVTVKNCDMYKCEFKDITARYISIIQLSGIEVYTVANTGTFDGCINYFPTLNNGEGYVTAGCWAGSLKEAVAKMERLAHKYAENNKKFRAVLSYFQACNPQAGIEIPKRMVDK